MGFGLATAQAERMIASVRITEAGAADGGETAVNIKGFDIDWMGNNRIELRRDSPPRHRYEFETSPDQRRIKRLVLTSPEDVTGGDPLLDAEQYEEEARKAAIEFLRQESRSR
jgi:hypothetical protein